FLVEVRDSEVRPAADGALPRRLLPEQQPKQCRLARPVPAEDAHAIAAHDARREVANDDDVAVPVRHVLGLEHDAARARAIVHRERDLSLARAARGALLPHRLERADAALVAGAARLDALADPRLLPRERLVEAGLGGGLVLELGLLALQVRLVVTGVAAEAPTLELHDARGHGAQEGAIVRDKQQGALEVAQEAFEPLDGVDVEMV